MQKLVKIIGLGAVLAVVGLTAQAQKCKFDYQKKDPLSGEATKGNTFGVKMWWKLGLNKVGNTYFIGMWININGNVRDIITPENTIIFKLANGEIITLKASDNFLPTAQATQTGVATSYRAKYDISEEDLRKIMASPLIYVKMEVGARIYDSEFNTKKGTEFQSKAKCILQ
jgi:hypothetical protein